VGVELEMKHLTKSPLIQTLIIRVKDQWYQFLAACSSEDLQENHNRDINVSRPQQNTS
jgi:hypothetical protein